MICFDLKGVSRKNILELSLDAHKYVHTAEHANQQTKKKKATTLFYSKDNKHTTQHNSKQAFKQQVCISSDNSPEALHFD